MTLDCPFRNPLQSRVIPVRSCYLTSFCVPLFLLDRPLSHHDNAAFRIHHILHLFLGPLLQLFILKSEVLEVVLLRAVSDGDRDFPDSKASVGRVGARFILSPVGSGFPAFARAPFQMEEQLPYHIFK